MEETQQEEDLRKKIWWRISATEYFSDKEVLSFIEKCRNGKRHTFCFERR